MMKRLLRTLLLILPVMAVFTSNVMALQPPVMANAYELFGNGCKLSGASSTAVCKEHATTTNPFIHAISVAVALISLVIGVAATVVIILSAFKMIRSNGNANEIASAKNGIIYALIGILVAVLAPILVSYILNSL